MCSHLHTDSFFLFKVIIKQGTSEAIVRGYFIQERDAIDGAIFCKDL